jgi:cytochrome oxidase assembly protein ShyY1|tara:strand:+ start:1259 stop:1432 length:174 start_codon:yes stop_codon:yes gene_type:complete
MLAPWQIEKLEEARREREQQERPALRLPLPLPPRQERPSSHEPQREQRGTTIIDFTF